ncbi:MAG: hypothetical protein DCC58_06725 [Chloroflexi bacterium]|nr:MAG: hypothetical protein DCC58_06725 [Chloroflexota bacterium]
MSRRLLLLVRDARPPTIRLAGCPGMSLRPMVTAMAAQETRTCPACGAQVGEDARFCPTCGKPLPHGRQCPACGALLPEGAGFCPACGVAIAPAPGQAHPSPAPPAAPARPARVRRTGHAAPAAPKTTPRRWPLALAGFVVVVALVGAMLAVRVWSGGDGTATPTPVVGITAFDPKPLVPGTTTPETASLTTTPGQPASLSLSDGTRVDLPALDVAAEVTLERQSNMLTFDDSGQQPTGSMRVLRISADALPTDFVPVITIPGKEAGQIIALNAARVGDLLIGDELTAGAVRFLPVERDAAGNLVVRDVLMQFAAPGERLASSAALQPAGQTRQAAFVISTFQEMPNWKNEPKLIRMVPDTNTPAGYRVPLASLSPAAQAEELKKPIKNVVIFVHGHNEAERRGNEAHETIEPWQFDYKYDVWTYMFEAFALQPAGTPSESRYTNCTAFYEFIYPTYRPIFKAGDGIPSLGESFAASLRADPQIRALVDARQPFNLTIVAHSMGGLVARAGVNALDPADPFDAELLADWRRLITWGTPHRGSAVVTLRFLLDSGIPYSWDPHGIYGIGLSIPLDRLSQWRFYRTLVEGIAVDTPGERDLRWDDDTTLHVWQAGWQLADGMGMGRVYSYELNRLNANDRYRFTDKYAAIFGTTDATITAPSTTLGLLDLPRFLRDFSNAPYIDQGEYLSYHMYQNPDMLTLDGVTFSVRQNDGAVPVYSAAGTGVVPSRNAFYIGAVDHEQFFGAPHGVGAAKAPSAPELGRKAAAYTLQLMNFSAAVNARLLDRQPDTTLLTLPECTCPELQLTAPVAGQRVPAGEGALLDISGRLVWPGVDQPEERITSARLLAWINTLEVLVDGQPVNDPGRWIVLRDDLTFETAVAVSSLPAGRHEITVRATFDDDTELISRPVTLDIGETTSGKTCWGDRPLDPGACLMPYMGGGATEPIVQWAFVQVDMHAIFFQLTYQMGDGLWDARVVEVPYDGSGAFRSGTYSGVVTETGVTLTITEDDGSTQVIVFDQ